jgi:hypothetical protein
VPVAEREGACAVERLSARAQIEEQEVVAEPVQFGEAHQPRV